MTLPNPEDKDKTRLLIGIMLAIGIILAMTKVCFSQCETYVFDYPQDQEVICFEDTLQASPPFTPDCPWWYNGGGHIIQFYTDGALPTKVIVEGDINYNFNTSTPIFVHAFILDDCWGSVVWSSSSCWDGELYWSGISQDWTLCLELSEGNYYLMIGNVGVWQVQDAIEGCIDVMIFQDGVLGLNVPEYLQKSDPFRNKLGNFDVLGRKL